MNVSRGSAAFLGALWLASRLENQGIARQPMGRIGKAEEIAALATYLASDESGFTAGQTHAIDGGWAV